MNEPGGPTRVIAAHVAATDWPDFPENIRHDALRTAVNSIGCVLGGAGHAAVDAGLRFAEPLSGPGAATVLARPDRPDAVRAAFVNCIAGSVHAFDDTHAHSLVHPGTPVTTAALAMAEACGRPVSGAELLAACAWGVETACRISRAVSAHMPMAFQQTGTVGTIGAAVAAGRILGLDEKKLCWAIGHAAAMAAGIRAGHGTTAMHLLHAHAASAGVEAALLAEAGIDAAEEMLAGRHGFVAAFAPGADPNDIVADIGQRFEISANTFKLAPSGTVTHPVIDACLELRQRMVSAEGIAGVTIAVSPAAVALADRAHPASDMEALVSLQHWAAAALLRGKAGIEEGSLEAVTQDQAIARLRGLCRVEADPAFAQDAARVDLVFDNGLTDTELVAHCRGSLARPMSDGDLDDKFVAQATRTLGPARARAAAVACWSLADQRDVAAFARRLGA